jgi:hypothetical protein
MLLCLGFVPVKDVDVFYLKNKEKIFDLNIECSELLLKYFMNTYLFGSNLADETERFDNYDIKIWNVFLRIKNGIPGTNNRAERWNITFNGRTCFKAPKYSLFYNLTFEKRRN